MPYKPNQLTNKAKRPPMTEEQMSAMVESKKTTQLYNRKQSSAKEEQEAALSKIIGVSLQGLQNVSDDSCEHIRLVETERVKAITMRYLEMCAEQSVIPSFVDVSSAIGCTCRAVYDFMKRNPQHPTSLWFRHLSDVFADIIAKSALSGTTRDIPSIFILKSKFGWREDTDDMPHEENSQENMDADTIMEKYSELPD